MRSLAAIAIVVVVSSVAAHKFHNSITENVKDSEMNKKIDELLKKLDCKTSFCSRRKNMKENKKKKEIELENYAAEIHLQTTGDAL